MQQELNIPAPIQYPHWHNQPLRLSLEQMDNPFEVISQFFDAYHLLQVRALLKKWLDDAMVLNEQHYRNHIPIYDEIEKLVEAGWLILQKSKEDSTDKKLVPSKAFKQADKDSLSAVLELLVKVICPERIFLLHSESTNLIDLLIVIADTSQKPFSHYETIVDIACLTYKEVNVSLHQSSELKQHLEDGRPFYITACTKDNLVYDNGATAFPVASLTKLEEMMATAKEKFKSGITKANSFFEGAKVYFENDNDSLTLFMLHQAAELTFRGIVSALMGRDVKEHHISILKRYTRRCAHPVNAIFPADTEKEEQLLSLLDGAYLAARYSDDLPVSKEDLLILFDKVQKLLSIANDVFAQKMNALQ